MTRVTAPNGDVYDLPATVASGLLRKKSGWSKAGGDESDSEPDVDESPDVGEEPVKPSKSGSKEAWQEYAAGIGVDTDGLTRDQIVEAVEAHEAATQT